MSHMSLFKSFGEMSPSTVEFGFLIISAAAISCPNGVWRDPGAERGVCQPLHTPARSE